MSDLIEREYAIQAQIENAERIESTKFEYEMIIHLEDAIEAISMVPTVVQHGWIQMGGGDQMCSYCRTTFKILPSKNFCPECGANMRNTL